MVKVFCDVCGKEIDYDVNGLNIDFNMFGVVSRLKSTSEIPKEYQLCDECAKKVNDFIISKKNGRPRNDF